MKKILLGTTAIVALATFSTEAAAAEKISLGLGGFQNIYAGKVSRSETTDTIMDAAVWTNTEVYFSGSTTLDNGITVGTKIELEVDGGATDDNIDRSYMTLSSDAMGTVTIGVAPHAIGSTHVGGPGIGPIGAGDVDGLDGGSVMQANEIGSWGDDTVKIKWVKSMGDVTIGASYTPGEGLGEVSNGKAVTHANSQDGFSAGLAYSAEMSGATVDVSGGYFHNGNANIDTTAVGVSVGMNGVTVGGSYHSFSDNSTASALDGNGYELGVGYETGALSFAANYYNSSNDGTTATAGDNQDTFWSVGVGYDLGAGVGLVAEYYDMSGDPEGATVALNSSAFIAGIEVGF